METINRMAYLEESTRKVAPTIDIFNFVEARITQEYHYAHITPWVITQAKSRLRMGRFFVIFHHAHDMKTERIAFMIGGFSRIIMFRGRYGLVEVKTDLMDGTPSTYLKYWIDCDWLQVPSFYFPLAADNPNPLDRSYLSIERFI
jgi:hypothetical protein